MSLQVHPWRLEDSGPQRAQEVAAQLEAEVTARQALLEANGLPLKPQVLKKVRKQLTDLAGVIDVWWQGVRQDAYLPSDNSEKSHMSRLKRLQGIRYGVRR